MVAGAVAEAVEEVPVEVGNLSLICCITRVTVSREKEIFRKQVVNYLFVPLTKFLTKNGPSYTKPV